MRLFCAKELVLLFSSMYAHTIMILLYEGITQHTAGLLLPYQIEYDVAVIYKEI